MSSHSLLALVITLSCFALTTCNHKGRTVLSKTIYGYPAKVSASRQGCPSDDQRELVRAEVREDIRNILQRHIRVYNDCKDAFTQGQNISGIYTIKPDNQSAFQAYCDMDTDGGGWTVFQRREDGSINFFRNWTDYQRGFGNLDGEFWLGLEKIHRLTSNATQLRVDMQDFEGNSAYAQYSSFSVGDSVSKYTLSISGYSGTAGDSLANGRHNGHMFSTSDQDNDIWTGNCAQRYKGGWWYDNCHNSNLNGLYHGGSHASYADGVNWRTWKGYNYSLKFAEIKLRKY